MESKGFSWLDRPWAYTHVSSFIGSVAWRFEAEHHDIRATNHLIEVRKLRRRPGQ